MELPELRPEDTQPHVVLAQEWEATAKYLKVSPLVVVHVALVFFFHACDYVGADYMETFKDIMALNGYDQAKRTPL